MSMPLKNQESPPSAQSRPSPASMAAHPDFAIVLPHTSACLTGRRRGAKIVLRLMPLSKLQGWSVMVRHRVFFSFHYDRDMWRVAQVRNNCAQSLIANDWESAKLGSSHSIAHWIEAQMGEAACTVVLIGSETSDREWVNYEICKSWNDEKEFWAFTFTRFATSMVNRVYRVPIHLKDLPPMNFVFPTS